MAETTILQVQGMTCGGELNPQHLLLSVPLGADLPLTALIALLSAACVKAIEGGLAGQVGIQSVSVALL